MIKTLYVVEDKMKVVIFVDVTNLPFIRDNKYHVVGVWVIHMSHMINYHIFDVL